MKSHSGKALLKWSIALALIVMIAVNALSTTLPLNGVTPKEVSDQYPNLFVPAPYVFSIWGVIYVLLIGYTLYALGLFRKKAAAENEPLMRKTGVAFIATSLLNALWLIVWHYGQIELSMIVMLLFLLTLIYARISIAAESLSTREKWFVRLPFSVYFGWITVATIANAVALFVAYGFSGLGLSEAVWTMIILAVGAGIGIATALRFRDAAYLAVFLWAYTGILRNHLGSGGFGGAYPGVITIAALALAAFAAVFLTLLFRPKRTRA